MEISGFRDGIPKEVHERWTEEQNGKSYTFGKQSKSAKHFVYYCQRDISDGRFVQVSSTGFETDRDLTHEQVETWPQFVAFMAEGLQMFHLGDQVRQIATGRVGKLDEERESGSMWRVSFSDNKEPILAYFKTEELELMHCPHLEPKPGFVPARGIM